MENISDSEANILVSLKISVTYFPEKKHQSIASRPSTATVCGWYENHIVGANCLAPPSTIR